MTIAEVSALKPDERKVFQSEGLYVAVRLLTPNRIRVVISKTRVSTMFDELKAGDEMVSPCGTKAVELICPGEYIPVPVVNLISDFLGIPRPEIQS